MPWKHVLSGRSDHPLGGNDSYMKVRRSAGGDSVGVCSLAGALQYSFTAYHTASSWCFRSAGAHASGISRTCNILTLLLQSLNERHCIIFLPFLQGRNL